MADNKSNHPTTLRTRIEDTCGKVIARKPHRNMMTPQTIDQRVTVFSSFTVVDVIYFATEPILVVAIETGQIAVRFTSEFFVDEDSLSLYSTGSWTRSVSGSG